MGQLLTFRRGHPQLGVRRCTYPGEKLTFLNIVNQNGTIAFVLNPGILTGIADCEFPPVAIGIGRNFTMLRIFRHFVPASIVSLAFVEISLICFAWHFYLLDKPFSISQTYDVLRSPSLYLALLTGAVMVLSGLYHTKVFSDYRIMAIQIAITFVFLCPIALAWGFYQTSDGTAGSLWAIDRRALFSWLLCILLTRTVFLMFADLNVFKRHVLVLGTGRKAARIAALAAEPSVRHFVPVAYLRCGDESGIVPAEFDVDEGDPGAITRFARKHRATEIVVATDDRRGWPVSQL